FDDELALQIRPAGAHAPAVAIGVEEPYLPFLVEGDFDIRLEEDELVVVAIVQGVFEFIEGDHRTAEQHVDAVLVEHDRRIPYRLIEPVCGTANLQRPLARLPAGNYNGFGRLIGLNARRGPAYNHRSPNQCQKGEMSKHY